VRPYPYFIWALCLMLGIGKLRADEIAGIGAALGKEGNALIIENILPASPAASTKELHVGDQILAIAQDKQPAVSVSGWSIEQAVAAIRGPKGTVVRLTVISPAKLHLQSHVLSLTRGVLPGLNRWGDGEPLAGSGKEAASLRPPYPSADTILSGGDFRVGVPFLGTGWAPSLASLLTLPASDALFGNDAAPGISGVPVFEVENLIQRHLIERLLRHTGTQRLCRRAVKPLRDSPFHADAEAKAVLVCPRDPEHVICSGKPEDATVEGGGARSRFDPQGWRLQARS